MKQIHLYTTLFAFVVLTSCAGNKKSDPDSNIQVNKHADSAKHEECDSHERYGEREGHGGKGHTETLSLTREQLDVLGIGIGESNVVKTDFEAEC